MDSNWLKNWPGRWEDSKDEMMMRMMMELMMRMMGRSRRTRGFLMMVIILKTRVIISQEFARNQARRRPSTSYEALRIMRELREK